MAKTKKCTKCLKRKKMTEFYTRKSSKDGRYNACKACMKAQNLETHIKNTQERILSTEKICSFCHRTKSSDDFYKAWWTKDGLASSCKDCRDVIGKQSHDKHRARNATKTRADIPLRPKKCSRCLVWKSTSEFAIRRFEKDCLNGKCIQCVALDTKNRRISNKLRNATNPVFITHKICTMCKTDLAIELFSTECGSKDGYYPYCKTCAVAKQLQRKRKLKASEDEIITGTMLYALKEHYNHCCAYCDARPTTLHIDHVLPLCRNGRHIMSNLLPACSHCNHTKNRRLPDEWFTMIGRKFEFDGAFVVRVA